METLIRSRETPRVRKQTKIVGDSRTKQSFQKECNINNIMAKYQKIHTIEHVNERSGEYGFASGLDLKQAMDKVQQAQTMFDELPSSIRTKFNNQPGEFLDFVQDEDNITEMIELGLAKADPRVKETQPQAEPEVEKTSEAKPKREPEAKKDE